MLLINYLLDMFGGITVLAGYVTSGNSFPKPLDEKEEAYYLDRLKEGDAEAKGILVERNSLIQERLLMILFLLELWAS